MLRLPRPLLPAFHRIRTHIQEPREAGLACIEGLPDPANLPGTEGSRRRRKFRNAKIDSFALFILQGILQGTGGPAFKV